MNVKEEMAKIGFYIVRERKEWLYFVNDEYSVMVAYNTSDCRIITSGIEIEGQLFLDTMLFERRYVYDRISSDA